MKANKNTQASEKTRAVIRILFLSLALSLVFLGMTHLALNYVLTADIYAEWYKVFLHIVSVVCGCLSAYLIWKPKKF